VGTTTDRGRVTGDGYFQVATAAGSREEALALADAVVGERLAACVQVLGPVESRYWWDDSVQTVTEWLCLAKTTAALVEALVARLGALHSYEVPEITAIPIAAGSPAYLAWIAGEVAGPPGGDGA